MGFSMNVDNIQDLTVEKVDGKRVVKYKGVDCPLIKRVAEYCELNTSYQGEVISSDETYTTPIGVVERSYRAHGAGLEDTSVSWRLVPLVEIQEVQDAFTKASKEVRRLQTELERLIPK
jgi:hypothetical protein